MGSTPRKVRTAIVGLGFGAVVALPARAAFQACHRMLDAAAHGAVVRTHARVVGFVHDDAGRVRGVRLRSTLGTGGGGGAGAPCRPGGALHRPLDTCRRGWWWTLGS